MLLAAALACLAAAEARAAVAKPGGAADSCHPRLDPEQDQYVVGYGSFMQERSKRRTAPSAGPNRPALVRGFQRGWFQRGSTFSQTTYLAAIPVAGATMNAVVYRLNAADEMYANDVREAGYCRLPVDASQIEVLDMDPSPRGQIWVYALSAERATPPDANFPIVQSYVDIFLGGCQEVAEANGLMDFPARCVTSTQGWSRHWVNDRIFPRRPFIHEPRAGQIDALIMRALPDLFPYRRIE